MDGDGDSMSVGRHTKIPTVRPATMEGTEPVRTYPVIPPTEVRAESMYAGVSDAYESRRQSVIAMDGKMVVKPDHSLQSQPEIGDSSGNVCG
jgi:hypothetical protein